MSSRLYLPVSTAAPVTPAIDANYNYTADALNRYLAQTKGSSAMTNGSTISPAAGQKALDRAYVSDQLAAQTLAGTVKCYLGCFELNNADNEITQLGIWVVSADGSTILGTPLAVGHYGNNTELSTSRTNRSFANAGTALTSTSIANGSRLVVGIGYTDSAGTTPQARAVFGETGSDLPEDETTTTSLPGWIETSQTLDFNFVAGSAYVERNMPRGLNRGLA